MPAALGEALPPAAIRGLEMRPSAPLEFSRAWLVKLDAVQRRRAELHAEGRLSGATPRDLAELGAALSGTLRVPVIPVRYADVEAPFPVEKLVDRLFGPSVGDTVSFRDYWHEVSGGLLEVTGVVTSWVKLPRSARHYLPREEYGWGRFGRITDLRRQVLEAVDEYVDFTQFDNDGPDGVPNSGDDDGYVDFVIFLYATDCRSDSRDGAIWPHRGAMAPFVTRDIGANGEPIRITDYVILPVQDPRTCGPAHVGVLAHETAHGFGLPDLYDYGGLSRGIGAWGLMGTGSHSSPHSPAHLGAWAKQKLGWVQVDWLSLSETVAIPPVERSARVFRHDVADGSGRYLLLEHRGGGGSDRDLPGHGLLVWSIDPERAELGVWNSDERRPAVGLLGLGRSGALVHAGGHDQSAPFPGRLLRDVPGPDLPVRVEATRDGNGIRAVVLPPAEPGWSGGSLRFTGVVGGEPLSRGRELRPGHDGAGWVASGTAPWLHLVRDGSRLTVEVDPYGLAPGVYSDTLELLDEAGGRISDRLPIRFEVASPGAAVPVATNLPWSWGLATVGRRLVQASYGRDALGLRPRPRLLELDDGDPFPRTLSRIPADALYSPAAGPGGATYVLAHALGQNLLYRVEASGDAAVVGRGLGPEPAYGLAVLPDGSVLVAIWSGRILQVTERGEVSRFADLKRPIYQIAADGAGTIYAALLSGDVLRLDASGSTQLLPTSFERGRLVAVTATPDGRVFAAERGGAGRIVELSASSGPRVLARVPGGEFYGLSADDSFLYALDLGQRQLLRLPITGPGSRIFAGERPELAAPPAAPAPAPAAPKSRDP